MCFLSAFVNVVGAARVALGEPARADDRGSEEPPVQVLLLPAGVAGPRRDVLDGAVAVSKLEPAVRRLQQLGHVTALARQPDELADPLLEAQAGQPRAVLGLQPPRPGGEEALQLRLVQELDEL